MAFSSVERERRKQAMEQSREFEEDAKHQTI